MWIYISYMLVLAPFPTEISILKITKVFIDLCTLKNTQMSKGTAVKHKFKRLTEL